MSSDNPDYEPKRLRSADFSPGRFRPHGAFDSAVSEDRIVRSVSTGPYNEEMSMLADRARRQLFATFNDGMPFAVITSVRESAMASHGTIDLTSRLMKTMRDEGLPMPAAVAWVIADDVEGKQLVKPYFERCFADAGVPFRVMDDEAAAEAWVKEVLPTAR